MLFLDVDGVLNPYAMTLPPLGAFSDFEDHVARGFRLRLSREMGTRLAALPVELCWATTWSESIDDDVSPYCGLPSGLRVAASPPDRQGATSTNWKLVQIRRIVETEGRPFVWVDDDALDWEGPDGTNAHAWSSTLDIAHLLVSPDPGAGLLPGEIDRIATFLSQIPGETASP